MLLSVFTNALSKHIEGLPPRATSASASTATTSAFLNAITDAVDRSRAKVHPAAIPGPQNKRFSRLQAPSLTT